jgi:hypothetical protein
MSGPKGLEEQPIGFEERPEIHQASRGKRIMLILSNVL